MMMMMWVGMTNALVGAYDWLGLILEMEEDWGGNAM